MIKRFTIFSILFWLGQAQAQITAQKWDGQIFAKKNGAVLLNLEMLDFLEDYQEGPVTFVVQSLISKKKHFLNMPKLSGFSGETVKLFVLPSGKYKLLSIQFPTESGKSFLFLAPKKKRITFGVKRQYVSNLGTYFLKKGPSRKGGKGWRIKVSRSSFDLQTKKDWFLSMKKNVAGVIDGDSLITTLHLGGKRVQKEASTVAVDDTDVYSVTSKNVTIGFYYTVDLLKHNRYAAAFAGHLNTFDMRLRECYQEAIRDRPTGKAAIVYSILYSGKKKRIVKAQTKKITSGYEKVGICLLNRLDEVSFPFNKTMLGRITFTMQHKYQ